MVWTVALPMDIPTKSLMILVSKVDAISELPEVIKNQNGEDSYIYIYTYNANQGLKYQCYKSYG